MWGNFSRAETMRKSGSSEVNSDNEIGKKCLLRYGMFQADSASHIFEQGQILMWQNMWKNAGRESFGDSSELIVSRSYGNGSHITSLVMQFKKIYGRRYMWQRQCPSGERSVHPSRNVAKKLEARTKKKDCLIFWQPGLTKVSDKVERV